MERQLAFDGHFAPLYHYETLMEMGTLTPLNDVHYADCTCYDCRAAHFPCDDWTCEYCDSVRRIRDNALVRNQIWGYSDALPQVKREYDGIIDYLTWLDDGKPDWSYMQWKYCHQCGMFISENRSYDNGGFCREFCQDQYERHLIYYCSDCGNEKVKNDGDTCRYCKQDQESEYYGDDSSGYTMSEVVYESDYSSVENCWIDPQGRVRYVPYCNHDSTARNLGFSGTSACERAGYIHVSIYWDSRKPFVYIPSKPTSAQIRTVQAYANVKGVRIPDSCKHIDIDEPKVRLPMTYNVVQSCLPRKLRELFYALSGD